MGSLRGGVDTKHQRDVLQGVAGIGSIGAVAAEARSRVAMLGAVLALNGARRVERLDWPVPLYYCPERLGRGDDLVRVQPVEGGEQSDMEAGHRLLLGRATQL
jgi:hypothetical protein